MGILSEPFLASPTANEWETKEAKRIEYLIGSEVWDPPATVRGAVNGSASAIGGFWPVVHVILRGGVSFAPHGYTSNRVIGRSSILGVKSNSTRDFLY